MPHIYLTEDVATSCSSWTTHIYIFQWMQLRSVEKRTSRIARQKIIL